MKRLEHVRILMYSHDTFGLGHLRRCRAIAHALVERFKGLHVLIISGSPIAGAFDFRARVDFVKIPSVIKLHNGEYTSIDRHIDIDETLKMRSAMIAHTARSFAPDIFIVDKEPMGLRGELEDTLLALKQAGCSLVLGLRDVMDSPDLLAREWGASNMLARIERYYNHVLVYGPPDFWNPLTGLDASDRLASRIVYTGFLERSRPTTGSFARQDHGPFVLVTTGGGGDGAELLRQVIAAYEASPAIDHDALMVLGPFMPAEEKEAIAALAANNGRVRLIEFDNRIEDLIVAAEAVVGMGGYNTFCEMMSFDKRALIVPRIAPRKEQYVRAIRASELGLVDTLHPDDASDPDRLAGAISAAITRPRPSRFGVGELMNGLDEVARVIEELILAREHPPWSVIEGGQFQ